MSQTNYKYPKIKIYSRDPAQPPVGANTIVEMNGVQLPMVNYVKVEFHARRVTKVLIEMYAHVAIDSMGELTSEIIELTPKGR